MPNVEIYLCEKKHFAKKYKNKLIFDLHFFEPPPRGSKIKVCNSQAEKMIRRTIKILPTWIIYPFYLAYLKSFFDKKHIIQNLSSNKDPLGLLDKYENHFTFTEEEKKKGIEILKKFGLSDKDKFICLNVRDSSYLKKNFPKTDFSYHDYRDLDIQIFKDAVNELLLQGFTVFRVGKTSNQSLNIDNKNYFDLTNNEQDDFVDVYLGANCYICITTSSGFDSTPYVFRKNMLYIQVPFSHFFSSSKRNFIFTRYHQDTQTKKYLKLNEIFERNVHNADTKEQFSKNYIELISPDSLEIKKIIQEAIKYFSNNSRMINYHKQRLFWQSYEDLVNKDKSLKNFHKVFNAYFSEIQINKLI